MRNFFRWLWAFCLWLWKPWPFGLTFAAPVLAMVLACVLGGTEPAFRKAGLILQVLGMLLVAWNIRDTWTLFGRTGLLKLVAQWLQNFPRYYLSVRTATVSSVQGASSLFGRAEVQRGNEPEASVETRLDALEKNQLRTEERQANFEQETRKNLDSNAIALDREKQDRINKDSDISTKLEKTAAGGLHIEIMGLVWLCCGAIITGLSIELVEWMAKPARLLQSYF